MLELTLDELLTTTRTVRKRLDLSRPLPRAVIEERLATRATIRELVDDFITTFGGRGYDLRDAVPGFQEYWDSKQAYDLIFGP